MSIDEVMKIAAVFGPDSLRAAIEQHVAEAVARERDECARVCDAIEDQFNERERRTFPELKTDAATGAGACGYAVRARAEKETT